MAISDNTTSKFNQTRNSSFNESDEVKKRRAQAQELMSSQPAEKSSTYADQVYGIYNKIKNREKFNYDAANDKAYQEYAAAYKALGDLASTQTAEAAQGLTGGYGSTYSPAVAAQTNNQYMQNLNNAQADYYQMAQDIYNNQSEMYNEQLETALEAQEREDESWLNQYNAWLEATDTVNSTANADAANELEAYSDWRDFWSEQYWNEQDAANDLQELEQSGRWDEANLEADNNQFLADLASTKTENKREEYWDAYEANADIIAAKCSEYSDKGDNSGMKSYLKEQVKKGNITQYDADNLYEDYKYTNELTITDKLQKYQNSKDNKSMKSYLNGLVKDGTITQSQADSLYGQYRYEKSSSSSGSSGSGGGSSSSSSSGSGSGSGSGTKSNTSDDGGDEDEDITSKTATEMGIGKGTLQSISMCREDNGKKAKITSLYTDGIINENQFNWLNNYYGF